MLAVVSIGTGLVPSPAHSSTVSAPPVSAESLEGAAAPDPCAASGGRDYKGLCGPAFSYPQWANSAVWADPETFRSVNTVRLTDTGGLALVARESTGLWTHVLHNGHWTLSSSGGLDTEFANENGWQKFVNTAHWTVIDGAAKLIARNPNGLMTYGWNTDSQRFEKLYEISHLADKNGWANDRYERTIQTIDVAGDGKPLLIARGESGLFVWAWQSSTKSWVEQNSGKPYSILSDAQGFDLPSRYETIKPIRIDGRDHLMARASDGLRIYRWAGAVDGFVQVGNTLGDLSDAHGYSAPYRYRAMGVSPIKNTTIWVRGEAGVRLYNFAQGSWYAVGPTLPLSDAFGWRADRYPILGIFDLTGRGDFALLARGEAGVLVFPWSSSRESWGPGSPVLPFDDRIWAKPEHYETLRVASEPGKSAMLVGRGPYGIRTFEWDETRQSFERPLPYGQTIGFVGQLANAYKDLVQLLGVEIRTLMAEPKNTTEAALDSHRFRLSERCKPLAQASIAEAPTYTDCTPPSFSSVDRQDWTIVSNQIVGELWATAAVMGHRRSWEATIRNLFNTETQTMPALGADLRLDESGKISNSNAMKIAKSLAEVAIDLVPPQYKKSANLMRGIALSLHGVGAAAEMLAILPTTPQQTYDQYLKQLVEYRQRMIETELGATNYIFADPSLTMSQARMIRAGLQNFDARFLEQAARLALARTVYQEFAKSLLVNADVTGCSNSAGLFCKVPTGGAWVEKKESGAFTGTFKRDSGCTYIVIIAKCNWWAPSSSMQKTIWDPISADCTYAGPAGHGSWTYGCSLGTDQADILRGQNGWNIPSIRCTVPLCRKEPS